MADINNLCQALPFVSCSPASISEMYQTDMQKLWENLENNCFKKNMLKLVNGFSKNNYTCGYYQEMSIKNLANSHMPTCLKIFHLNIISFSKNGLNLSVFIECLKKNRKRIFKLSYIY